MSFSLNANSGTKVLAQTAVALAAAVGLSGCGTPAPELSQADQLAVAVVNNLAVSNAAAATTAFSPAMAQVLPAANLTEQWKQYQKLLGDYKSHGQPEDVTQGALTEVSVPLSMAQKPGHLRVTVDETGHVAGLFFLE